MSERTLESYDLDLRRPTYEMQRAALAGGYSNVRDWVLDSLIKDVRELQEQVALLTERLPLHGEIENP